MPLNNTSLCDTAKHSSPEEDSMAIGPLLITARQLIGAYPILHQSSEQSLILANYTHLIAA